MSPLVISISRLPVSNMFAMLLTIYLINKGKMLWQSLFNLIGRC
ncbi:hypothetical protein HMPREF3203_03092 [Proteus mirabilis]|nr:hypothetical protein HMPREF3203_03092 [Proteus mirabilis]